MSSLQALNRSSSPISAEMQTLTFYPFARLPIEIRTMIWRASRFSRFVRIDSPPTPWDRGLPARALIPKTLTPVTFRVCHESRTVAFKHHAEALTVKPRVRLDYNRKVINEKSHRASRIPVYFSPAFDTLCVLDQEIWSWGPQMVIGTRRLDQRVIFKQAMLTAMQLKQFLQFVENNQQHRKAQRRLIVKYCSSSDFTSHFVRTKNACAPTLVTLDVQIRNATARAEPTSFTDLWKSSITKLSTDKKKRRSWARNEKHVPATYSQVPFLVTVEMWTRLTCLRSRKACWMDFLWADPGTQRDVWNMDIWDETSQDVLPLASEAHVPRLSWERKTRVFFGALLAQGQKCLDRAGIHAYSYGGLMTGAHEDHKT